MHESDKDETLPGADAIQYSRDILFERWLTERNFILASRALAQKTKELIHSLTLMGATPETGGKAVSVSGDSVLGSGIHEKHARIRRIPLAALLMAAGRKNETGSRILKDSSGNMETRDLLKLADGRVFQRVSRINRVGECDSGRVWSYKDITERRFMEEALRDDQNILELLNRVETVIASCLDLHTLVQTITDAGTRLCGATFGAFFFNASGVDETDYPIYTSSGAPREVIEKIGFSLAGPLLGPANKSRVPIRCDDVLTIPGMSAIGTLARSYMAVPVKSRSGETIGGLFFAHTEPGAFDEMDERIIVAIATQAADAIDNTRLYEAMQRAGDERGRLIEREQSARASAERMGKLQEEFLSTLAHELRSPLNVIVGWSKLLRHGARDIEDIHKGLVAIERSARIQSQLIDDLFDMNRIASGTLQLDMKSVAPAAFIEAAIESVRLAADAKDIRFTKKLDPEAAPISADPIRLQQILWNLLSDAIKFSEKGGEVQVRLRRKNSNAEIFVEYTGVCIKQEFLTQMFHWFGRAEDTSNPNRIGVGLGLSIVEHLVELHGGNVRLESQGDGHGSMICIQLPLMEANRSRSGDARVQPETREPVIPDFTTINLSGIKVLVVDDEMDARDLISRVLADCHAEVLNAGSAAEALLMVENERPNLLLSDIGMADVDGYELLKRVRALGGSRGGTVPAIALTAFTRSEDRKKALQAGYLVHVPKPFEPSQLVATIASVAAGHSNNIL